MNKLFLLIIQLFNILFIILNRIIYINIYLLNITYYNIHFILNIIQISSSSIKNQIGQYTIIYGDKQDQPAPIYQQEIEIGREGQSGTQNIKAQKIIIDDKKVSRSHILVSITNDHYMLIQNKGKEPLLFRQHLQQDYQILDIDNDTMLDLRNVELKPRRKGYYIVRLQYFQNDGKKIESFTEYSSTEDDTQELDEQSEQKEQEDQQQENKQLKIEQQNTKKQTKKQAKSKQKQNKKQSKSISEEFTDEYYSSQEIKDSVSEEIHEQIVQTQEILIDSSELLQQKLQNVDKIDKNIDKLLIIPKILKSNKTYKDVLETASKLKNQSIFIQTDSLEQDQYIIDILRQLNVKILTDIKQINEASCLLANQVSRSAKYLSCLCVGLPIFNYQSLVNQSDKIKQKQIKLQLLQPQIQQIRQLFVDDTEFQIQQFDQPFLLQNYFSNRLNGNQQCIICTQESLSLIFDKENDNPNVFGFIFLLSLLNFQVRVILNNDDKSNKEYIVNSKLRYKHVKVLYSDDYLNTIQSIIHINKKNNIKTLFLYNDSFKIEKELQLEDLKLIRKVKIIESIFLHQFQFQE